MVGLQALLNASLYPRYAGGQSGHWGPPAARRRGQFSTERT